MVEERQQTGKTEVLRTVGRLLLHHTLIPRFKNIKGGLVRLPTIEDFMEITINNWAKHHPRSDLKSVPWCRVSTLLAYDQNLFPLTASQKWLWVFCILEAGRVNKNGTFSGTTKWLSHTSGCTESEVEECLKHLQNQTIITITDGSVREPTGSVRKPTKSVPNVTNITNTTNITETLPERSDSVRVVRAIPLPTGPKFKALTLLEMELGDDWLAHALEQMPWKAKARGWDPPTFSEQLRKVKNTVGLNDEGMRAVFEFVSEHAFWTQNAVCPKGLLNKVKSGLRKIDTILSQMKTPVMRRDEKLLEWANGPEQDLWGEK